jgi:hypothetical protein
MDPGLRAPPLLPGVRARPADGGAGRDAHQAARNPEVRHPIPAPEGDGLVETLRAVRTRAEQID